MAKLIVSSVGNKWKVVSDPHTRLVTVCREVKDVDGRLYWKPVSSRDSAFLDALADGTCYDPDGPNQIP